MNDVYFMNEAIKEALKAKELMEIPIGAVIVKDNVIIGRGHNKKETDKDATLHAEIIAIKEACENLESWRLLDCSIYVTLEPCAMCAGALVNARISRAVISVRDEKTGACGTVLNIAQNESLNHQIELEFGLCEEESRNILQEFFRDLRKIKASNKKVSYSHSMKESE